MSHKPGFVPFRYVFMSYRRDQFWLPVAFWALFLIVILIVHRNQGYDLGRSFLGFALPMLGGFLSAYAVVGDPAIELQLSAPRPAWKTLLERLGIIFLVLTLVAVTFQIALALIGIDLAPMGPIASRQLAWLVPTLTLMCVSSAVAFLSTQATTSALFTGTIWFTQLILKDWFAIKPVARNFYLFMGAHTPENPYLLINQVSLLVLSAVLLVAGAQMLKRSERYI